MESRICLLHAGATGCETLKNLVLPGCGFVCVVDDGVVTERDAKNNFFTPVARVGEPRARVALETLLEMNEDVRGEAVIEEPSALIASQPDFFSRFTLVVASQMRMSQLVALESVLTPRGIPFIAVRTFGLLASLRVFSSEHCVAELKPENQKLDLRLANPWPELRAYVEGVDLEAMDDEAHRHTPYIVLLVKAAAAWRASHEGKAPVTRDSKAFAALIKGMERHLPDRVEENFVEAQSNKHLAYGSVSGNNLADVRPVLDDAAAAALTPASSRFWFLAAAVRDFVAAHGGELPLSAELPDMTSTTAQYMALQRLYKAKAEADAGEVWARVQALVAGAGAPASVIDEAYVREGCRHARFLAVFRYHAVAGEAAVDDVTRGALGEAFDEVSWAAPEAAEQAPVLWYTALRAADAFADEHGGRAPGAEDATLAADAADVLRLGQAFLESAGVSEAGRALFTAKHAQEITRYGGCEPQVVASYIGGVAAQEAVKQITHQFEPLNNTFIYNGINSGAARFAL